MSSKAQQILEARSSSHSQGWTSGFFVLGALLSFLGSLLVAWTYHIGGSGILIGWHFLCLGAGYMAGSSLAARLARRFSVRYVALVGCVSAAIALTALEGLGPPVVPGWRLLVLAAVGLGAGLLAASLLYLGAPACTPSLAPSARSCGIWFGFGCLLTTVLVGVAYLGDWARWAPVALAAIPTLFLVLMVFNRWQIQEPAATVSRSHISEPRAVAGVLLALLMFFQFGNEWALAGWLPLFLIRTLGSSPDTAIFALALFFAALLTGRAMAQPLVSFLSHRRLLIASISTAIAGYLLLSLSGKLADAYTGILLTGLGFGPIYPLVANYLDNRFAYHPSFYNGLFAIAVSGGMGAAWALGYVDEWFGMRSVLVVPAVGSIVVLALALMLMLEARLMGANPLTASESTR